MQQCITQPALKNRGKSVPVTKGRKEKVKKSKQQPKSKATEFHQQDETQLKSPQKQTIQGKRKNRGYSTQPNEEMNALILSLWERHYIEHSGEYKKTGGIKLWTTGQQEEENNPNQNSSSNKSRSFKPTPEELNIIEQELNLFYGPFYFEFIEDAFQFEALYYQLAKRNFFRTPTTSSPLVLCYYFFSLFFSFYKPENLDIIRRICPYTQIFLEKIEKANKQVRRGLLKLFRSINISENPGLPLQFQDYLLYMIKMIQDKQNFNLKLIIDDFIKYSELYSNNQIEYLQHLENEQHKKHNLCIGFLRFIFSYEIEVDQKTGRQNIDIRIPLGDFQSSPLQDPKVTIIMEKIFHKEEWFKQEKGKPHSEKVLLSWIIQNCQELAQRISLKLDLVQVKNLVLEKVYLEKLLFICLINNEVCNSCIDMLLAFPHYYVSDLILEKLKLNQTIKIHEEFHLIVVTQFLNESQSKGALQLRKRVQSFQDFRKKTIYFEVGYVGLITEIYFKNRYLSCKSQVFTQQIDEVKLGNTFFLSDDLDEELQEQQTVQQHDNQSKSSSKSSSRAVIYTPLTTALNKIKQEQTQQKKIIHVSNEKTIYQERILQCYQLIWKFYQNLDQPLIEIDVHFFSRYLYYWFIGDYNNTLNFHYEFLKWISQETQDQSTFLDKTRMKLNYQTIFNNGNANIKLLLFDYIFLNHYTTQKPQFDNFWIWDRNLQQEIKHNIGTIKLFISTSEQKMIELKVSNDPKCQFLEYLSTILHMKLAEIQKNEQITLVEILICTIQQLSSEFKNQLQQQLIANEGNINFNFYYMFIRRLRSEFGMNQFQDEQFILQDPNQTEARYSKLNDEYQISFYDMNEDQLGCVLCFSDKEEKLVTIQQK